MLGHRPALGQRGTRCAIARVRATPAGDHSGQAIYDYVNPDGTHPNFPREMLFVNITQVIAGAGFYWNIAHP